MPSPSNVAECLAGTLDTNPNVRMAAELKLAEFMAIPGELFTAGVAFALPIVHVLL